MTERMLESDRQRRRLRIRLATSDKRCGVGAEAWNSQGIGQQSEWEHPGARGMQPQSP